MSLELLAVLVAMPIAIVAVLGWAAFHRETPLAFTCRRCGADFERPAHEEFPASCPRCGARDWNV